jgi:hypothetical protein
MKTTRSTTKIIAAFLGFLTCATGFAQETMTAAAKGANMTRTYGATMTNLASGNSVIFYDDFGFGTTIPTMGKGGAGGNGGALVQCGEMLLAANYGSSNISVFLPSPTRFAVNLFVARVVSTKIVQPDGSQFDNGPASIACDANHVVVGGDKAILSFRYANGSINPNADGVLVHGNPAFAQVAVANSQAYYTVKALNGQTSGGLYVATLNKEGIGNTAKSIKLPDNTDTPFALVASPDQTTIYAILAHNPAVAAVDTTTNKVVSVAYDPISFISKTPHATCWFALYFSNENGPVVGIGADTPASALTQWSMLPGLVQYGKVGATLPGAPTDIAAKNGKLLAIYLADGKAYSAMYDISGAGNMKLLWTSGGVTGPAFNGSAIYTLKK